MLDSTIRMNARRNAWIAEATDELATLDPHSPRARNLRHTIKMNEQAMEEPYTDAHQQNSLGKIEMGMGR